jgi:hypothetical protein
MSEVTKTHLSAEEVAFCRRYGFDESAFLAEQNHATAANPAPVLPRPSHAATEHGLNAEEAKVADLLGMPYEQYAAEKVQKAG